MRGEIVALLISAIGQTGWGELSTTYVDWEASTDRTIRIEIGNVRDGPPGPSEYWMRETDLYSKKVRYADSRACPAVRQVVASLREITPPRPAPPGLEPGGSVGVVTDIPQYSIRVPVEFEPGLQGTLGLVGDALSPLGPWFERATAALKPCWTLKPPA